MTDNGAANKARITFTHPRDERTFEADIGPGTTAAQAIDGLVKASFLEPRDKKNAYTLALARTSAQIPASASLVAAGVKHGDTITVVEPLVSAGR